MFIYLYINFSTSGFFPGELSVTMKVASRVTKDLRVRLFFFIGIVTTVVISMPVMADTWTVCHTGCNFTTIQDAINAASDGDTILVMAGEYHEHVVVNKTLTITGEDANTTVINGDRSGNVITVVADGVILENLKATGSIRYNLLEEKEYWPGYGIGALGVSDIVINSCIVTDCQVGIYGNTTSGFTIEGNEVFQNDVHGIFLEYPQSSSCFTNYVHDNSFGIMIGGDRGDFSCRNNQIIHNQHTGLCILRGLQDSVIEENLIQDNNYVDFESLGDYNSAGGYFEWLENVTIQNNRFIHNGGVGLFIDGMLKTLIDENSLDENYAGFSYLDGWVVAPDNTVTLSNTVNGLPILYLEGVHDRDITGSEYATVYLVGCRNITIHDMVMESRNGFGILVRGGEYITIRDNSISNNLYQNILVSYVENAKIVNNCIGGALYGAGVLNSSFVNLTGNHVLGNSRGLAAASENEYVWFFNNTLEGNMVGFSFENEAGREVSVIGNRIVGNDPSLHLRDVGILIMISGNIHIRDNDISSMYEGVFLHGGEMNVIEDNTLSECKYGIELSPFSPGIPGKFIPAISNWITNNHVSAENIAFFTTSDQKKVYANYIYLNNFLSRDEPPALSTPHPAEWNLHSSFDSPLTWGLRSSADLPSASDTQGEMSFKDNTFNTESPWFYSYGGRTFKGYLGNYWNRYNDTDTDGNGVGTAPYPVMVNNTDHYPLLSPISFYQINPSPSFYADFEADPVSGASPLSVQYMDHSVGNPTRYLYRFGDGFMSMSKNPVHVYLKPGNYTVSLTIWKMDGGKLVNATTYRAGYITVEKKTEPPVEVDFSASPLSGKAPLKVSFAGTCSVTPILWKYSFGDGFMGTRQNPVHTYRKPGTYNVTLTVWTMGSEKRPVVHTVEKPGYITVT
jgi:PKD repeat protein